MSLVFPQPHPIHFQIKFGGIHALEIGRLVSVYERCGVGERVFAESSAISSDVFAIRSFGFAEIWVNEVRHIPHVNRPEGRDTIVTRNFTWRILSPIWDHKFWMVCFTDADL